MKHKSEEVYLDIIRLAANRYTPSVASFLQVRSRSVRWVALGKNPIALLIKQGAAD
jgi:hypothetical protein